MARFNCEIIGIVAYSPDFSYQELYEIEHTLIGQLQHILEQNGGDHLDFWGTGDCLQFQCVLNEYEEDSLDAIVDDLAESLADGLHGKAVCLEKHLDTLSVYYFRPQVWSKDRLEL